MELAVAATKSTSLAVVIGAVARSAGASAKKWPTSDLVRLLLAMAKAKGSLNPEDKRQLLSGAADALTPELGGLLATDLVKLILAIAGDGKSELLEVAAEEAVEQRISSFPPAQLFILTQGIVQGLGGSHPQVEKLLGFWTETLKEPSHGDNDDEVNKRRRELEQRGRLSADQLVQLARITAVVPNNMSLMEVIGVQLFNRARELTDAGKKLGHAAWGRRWPCAIHQGRPFKENGVWEQKQEPREREGRKRWGEPSKRPRQ